jgi:hypothetical protein
MLRDFSVLLFSVFLLASISSVDAARAQGLGLSAGANFNSLSDIETSSGEATFDNASGWHLHLWFDLPVGPVAVRPGLRYMRMGELFTDVELDSGTFDEDEVTTLLEIPIDVRIRMGLPLITPYVLLGPVLRFPANADDEDRLESFSLAGGAGIGVELGLGGIKLYPELKYTFGITRFTQDSYEIGGVEIVPDEDQRLNAIMLSVGIGL